MRWAGCDATEVFNSANHSSAAIAMLQNFCVGKMEKEELYENREQDNVGAFPLSSAAALER